MKKIEVKTTVIHARLYDEELLKQIELLVAEGRYESKTEVVARCIELALPKLVGEKKSGKEKKEYDTERALRQQNAMLRELSVNAAMTFNLVSSLFGERLKTLADGKTNAESMGDGSYETLPEYYQDRLNELMKIL